jgi:hypothetical protein
VKRVAGDFPESLYMRLAVFVHVYFSSHQDSFVLGLGGGGASVGP